MDIFTTQLTRVVPVPIKPANLKVKALLKEAGTSKLKEDPDHLENHDYYFAGKQGDNKANKENEQEPKPAEQQAGTTDEKSADSKEKVKHLDLYV
ncbi:hypothetical protein [Candidatus Colwellia aromaticivorans]|uniref:hypothetical protein n=1 Tax=Candidatus Colwellia aromaticivorans TaxID=2267621 RepID=UPI000DF29363|nr:hypothetical protein [Candidatus Colwellia aromaticivorans]